MRLILLATIMHVASAVYAQKLINIYPGKIPGSRVSPNVETTEQRADGVVIIEGVQQPALAVYLAPKPNGTALLICPGGGYSVLAWNYEGTQLAEKLNEWGITAFVLKYRLPDERWMVDPATGPLQDVQQAIITIRQNASRWKIDPQRLGVAGFSAGGHLASTAATLFKSPLVSLPDGISIRPDFQVLIYPVISFSDSIGHRGSREKLIGHTPSADQVKAYSSELNVTEETPPCLLVHCREDDVVSYRNAVVYYDALIARNVPADLHLYAKGGHGFGMFTTGMPHDSWIDVLKTWILNIK